MVSKNKILKFRALQIQLKQLKEQEANLRREICDGLLHRKRVGTHTFKFDDIIVKAVKKVTHSVDADKLSAHWDNMSVRERDCFKYKPSFISSAYSKLGDHTDVVDDCITVKPAMPTLEVKIPETE